MSDIGERVKKIVVEHLGVEADKVTVEFVRGGDKKTVTVTLGTRPAGTP